MAGLFRFHESHFSALFTCVTNHRILPAVVTRRRDGSRSCKAPLKFDARVMRARLEQGNGLTSPRPNGATVMAAQGLPGSRPSKP